jgi:hypothetical protein
LSAIVLLGLVRQSCTYTVGEKEERIISRKFTDYNHQYNEQKLQTQFISVTAKRKAADDISSRPSKICRDVIKENLQSHLNVIDLRQNTFHIYYRGTYFFLIIDASKGTYIMQEEVDILHYPDVSTMSEFRTPIYMSLKKTI